MEKLGTGILTWCAPERRSDRYGFVYLLEYGDSESATWRNISLAHKCEGQHGKLLAIVKETRQSTHIGDLFHGVFPRIPKIDQQIVLGEGTLTFKDDKDDGGKRTEVGLIPDDGRERMWLDMRSLYDCHEQTIDLYFEPTRVQ